MFEEIKDRKVFLTGADGFIGSHLTELLINNGAKVRALVYYNSWNEIGWLKDIPRKLLDQVELVRGDIRDAEFVRQSMEGMEYLFHLSSLIAIPYSYDAPSSYVDTNITGALNVLNACRNSSSLIRMVHVSTSEVYGSAQYVPINEEHPLVGQSPYSASKIGADKMAESYYLSFDVPIVTARPFNTFGPRQTARAVIPTIASQLLAGCVELKLGSLTPTRDFNFAQDTARGLLFLGLCDEAEGEVVNIGTGEEWSIGETVKLLAEITNRKVDIVSDESRHRPAKSEVNRLVSDNSKLRRLTNWSSSTPFKKGLELTVEWISKNLEHFESNNYSK